MIPNYVKEEKFEILIYAGMNRIRMGIQSGSERILKFYSRPSPPRIINNSTSIINKFKDYTVKPSYDIIVDNPVETKQDVVDTLELLYNMPRPYTVNIFSLRVMPNTDLYDQFKALNISHDDIYNGYFHIAPTLTNVLIFLLSFYKPPRKVFDWCLERSLPFKQEQPQYPILYLVFRFFSLASRALSHLRHMDFPYLPGHAGAILHYTGFLWMWKKLFVPKFPLENLNNYKTKEIKEYGKENIAY